MLTTLFSSTIFALFVIIVLGFLVGRINIKGITLDVSAVIFVALLFGHYGVVIPDELGNFGMVLFIFSIGIQAGPGFFASFKSKGMTLVVISSVIVLSAAAVTLAASYIFDLTAAETAGLFTGAMSSTPGLATAKEVVGDSAAIAYSIAYPFGVIGIILFIKLLPKFLKINIQDEESKLASSIKTLHPDITSSAFRVSNELVFGRTLQDLSIRKITGATISRMVHDGNSFIPRAGDTLSQGDLVKAVGTEESLVKIEKLIGERFKGELPFGENIALETALLTTKSLVGTTIDSLNLQQIFGCTITRVHRAGIDLTPSPSLSLKFGDKLTIVGPKENMKEVFSLLGNQRKLISDTDFFPIALGIVIGIIAGNISVSFSDNFSFSLGLTGGILLTALLLSAIGKTGNIIWTMSTSANQLLRQLGLLLFLANVGTAAGATLIESFKENGLVFFASGVVITLVPMILATIVARKVYKINPIELLGTIAGGMTSTPGLAAADSMCSSSITSIAYATIYPVALVILIITTQIIALVV